MRKKLFAPGWFGSGTRPMIAAAYGSIRPVGIVLFANGRPVSGSRTDEVKTPARSSAVGTRVRRVTPRVIRVPSKSPKKNALSFTIGPPRLPPYWFWSLAGFAALARTEKKSFESNDWLRK